MLYYLDCRWGEGCDSDDEKKKMSLSMMMMKKKGNISVACGLQEEVQIVKKKKSILCGVQPLPKESSFGGKSNKKQKIMKHHKS